MTAPARFTQADVTRMAKGIRAAGLPVSQIAFDINKGLVAYISPADNVVGSSWDDAIEAPRQRKPLSGSAR